MEFPSELILLSHQSSTLLLMPQERVKAAAKLTHVVAFLVGRL